MVFLSERKIRLFTCFVGAITMLFHQNERYAYLHVS